MEKYKIFEDGGHSWLEVEKEEIKKLNIADDITHCSYINDDKVYLEEDCDMITFAESKFDEIFDLYAKAEFIYLEDNPIRSYESYSKEKLYN